MTLHPGSRRPLPHLAYLEALAESEEDTQRWHALTAGYAALQLFDAWAECDGAVRPSDLELLRVRRRVELMSDGDPIRRCLLHLVEVLGGPVAPRGSNERRLRHDGIARIVAAYGKLLQYESSWALSRDVYATLIDFAPVSDDEERLLDAMLMVAFCDRMLGRFDDARFSYGALRELAGSRGSEKYLLLSELGFAKIAIERGNLPAAAGMLDRILEDTRVGDHDNVRAKALMDRARVANQLGDLTAAAVLGHQALEHTTDPMDRDRILVNLGVVLVHLGLWDEARDAYLLVSATAQESGIRTLASINLLELAYLEGREPTFEQYRRRLSSGEMPPYLRAVFHEAVAHGCRTFGRYTEAQREFEHMRDLGEKYELNEFTVRAEMALRDVSKAVGPSDHARRTRVSEQPTELVAVAHAVTEMRVLAGVSEG